MRSSPLVRSALAVVVLGAVAAPAAAQPAACPPNVAPQFCKNFDDGVLEFNRAAATGDYEPARKLFVKALDFEKNLPGPYRYLAEVANKQGKFQDCLDYAVKVVKLAPDSNHAPIVRTTHAECRKGLNYPDFRDQFGSGGAISVMTPGIDGAKVKLNGLTMGATPFEPRPFAVGPVDVEVEKKGYISGKAAAEILPGLVTDVIFDMKEDPNAPKDGNGGPDGKGEDVADGWAKLDIKTPGATATWDGEAPKLDEQGRIRAKPGLHDVRVEAAGHDPWVRRVRIARGQSRTILIELRDTSARQGQRMKGWMALGAAVAFTAAGAGFAIKEAKYFERANDIWFTETRRNDPDSANVIPVRTREDLQKATDRGKRYQLLSLASYGLAAAALGVSSWFFLKERPAERKGYAAPVAITPIFTPGDAGVGVQATYSKEIDW